MAEGRYSGGITARWQGRRLESSTDPGAAEFQRNKFRVWFGASKP
jgi:hypothetical protein